MKKSVLLFLFFIGAYALHAQEPVWYNNMKEAQKIAEQTKKPLMLFFTGSDWCGWCRRLQNEVFKKPEFATWATNNVVLVEVDFPARTVLPQEIQTQNQELQAFFGVKGYPTVWLVNASKKENAISFSKLGTLGYMEGGPAVWLKAASDIVKQK
jgi:thioredoxin-related protein